MNRPSLATFVLAAAAGMAHGSVAHFANGVGHNLNIVIGDSVQSRPRANNQRKRRKKARIFRSHNRRAQRGRCR